ncbi:MAG: hypothetical protein AAFP79_10020 [Pseudomonadota bacterium]
MDLKTWRFRKVQAGFVIGALVAAYILGTAADLVPRKLDVLLCLAGGAAGWTTGILFSPKDGQFSQFETFRNAIGAFLGGIFAAEAIDLAGYIMSNDSLITIQNTERAFLFAISFALALLFTFVGRYSDSAFDGDD